MNFGQTLAAVKEGKIVARKGWNGKGMWIKLQVPDKNSKMSLPYIYIMTTCGNRVPWAPSQADMLAEDWSIVCQ